jgi:hypothetical protein
MLYPLSYDGLRPISYPVGDTQSSRASRGVPTGAIGCAGGGFVAGGRTRGAFSGTGNSACPVVPAGGQR